MSRVKRIGSTFLETSSQRSKSLIEAALRRVGKGMHRIPPRLPEKEITNQDEKTGLRLYVGCGEDRREGYMGCDVRPLPTVHLVCKAWEVSQHCRDVQEIYSRHLLEHLTLAEVTATLDDWFQVLGVGGKVHIIVPNLDFHIEQWLRAKWSEEALGDKWSDANWSFAGLYGWQRECDPREDNYNTTYWDVHKSGYNVDLLTFLLNRSGFSNVQVDIEDKCHLVALARKRVTISAALS